MVLWEPCTLPTKAILAFESCTRTLQLMCSREGAAAHTMALVQMLHSHSLWVSPWMQLTTFSCQSLGITRCDLSRRGASLPLLLEVG